VDCFRSLEYSAASPSEVTLYLYLDYGFKHCLRYRHPVWFPVTFIDPFADSNRERDMSGQRDKWLYSYCMNTMKQLLRPVGSQLMESDDIQLSICCNLAFYSAWLPFCSHTAFGPNHLRDQGNGEGSHMCIYIGWFIFLFPLLLANVECKDMYVHNLSTVFRVVFNLSTRRSSVVHPIITRNWSITIDH